MRTLAALIASLASTFAMAAEPVSITASGIAADRRNCLNANARSNGAAACWER